MSSGCGCRGMFWTGNRKCPCKSLHTTPLHGFGGQRSPDGNGPRGEWGKSGVQWGEWCRVGGAWKVNGGNLLRQIRFLAWLLSPSGCLCEQRVPEGTRDVPNSARTSRFSQALSLDAHPHSPAPMSVAQTSHKQLPWAPLFVLQ